MRTLLYWICEASSALPTSPMSTDDSADKLVPWLAEVGGRLTFSPSLGEPVTVLSGTWSSSCIRLIWLLTYTL